MLLAMAFAHPVHESLLKTFGVDLDQRGNVRANMVDYQTSRPNVFPAGGMR
jgi:glutamate synthase (NADPH) small chain